MAEVSRRVFLGTGAGGALAGVALAAMPGLASASVAPSGPSSAVPAGAANAAVDDSVGSGTYVVHVRDARNGVVSVMTGESEVVVHDPGLVARVVAAANGH